MSPPERLGSSSSPGSGGSVGERRRPPRGEAEPVVPSRNSAGPKPNVTVRRDGGQAERLAGVVRRRVRVVVDRPDRRARRSSGAAASVQSRSRSRSSSRLSRDDVERGEQQPVLRGRRDARLVRAVERDRVAVGLRRRRRSSERPTARPRRRRRTHAPRRPRRAPRARARRDEPGRSAISHERDDVRRRPSRAARRARRSAGELAACRRASARCTGEPKRRRAR